MDTKTPLNQLEASRVKTIFEEMGVRLKYRELTGFSPESIARRHNLLADEIAKAAGRIKQNEKVKQ